MFWFHKINQNNAALVRPSPKNFRILWCVQAIQSLGISKIWLWSTCAGKTEQAEQFQARHTSRPWICSRRSGRTWRSFGTSRLWHFFANIRRIGLRRWLDAFVATVSVSVFGLDWFTMVYHGLPPFKSIQERHFPEGKPKQQGRQLLQKELPVQAARRGAWRRLQGMGGPWPPYPADGDDNVSDGVWPAGLEDWPECVEVAMMSFHDQPQSNTCPIIVYGNHSWIPAVNCSQYHPWVEANIASPTKRWSAENCRKQSGQSRLVKVGLAWCRVFFLVPCGVVADGHHKQRAILRRNQIPGWGGHCNIYRSSAECFQLPEAPDGATALGGLPWSGWLGGLKMFQICCIFDMSIIWRIWLCA